MVVFLDIDGTLSAGKNHVSLRVKEAIRQARSNGHKVLLCTGRNRKEIEDLLYIGFDGAITSGGGYIEIEGKEIFHIYNDHEDIGKAIELLEKYHVLYKLESDYVSFQEDAMLNMFNRFSDDLMNYKKAHAIYPISEFKDERIQTIYFFGKKEDLLMIQKELEDRFAFYLYNPLPNGLHEGEVMNKNVSKGAGVLKVMEYYHLPIEESIGFGDSMNDLALITTVHTGVVMNNGAKELKQYATSICEGVEADGIYHEFLRRGLIHEI